MMLKCVACGSPMQKGVRFCPTCGTPVRKTDLRRRSPEGPRTQGQSSEPAGPTDSAVTPPVGPPTDRRRSRRTVRFEGGPGRAKPPAASPPEATGAPPASPSPSVPALPRESEFPTIDARPALEIEPGAAPTPTPEQPAAAAEPAQPAAEAEEVPFRMLGDFKVLRLLGRGGMGAVYEGFDENLHRRVALKVLSPELAGGREHVARFLAEARAVAQINHPNVVQVFFTGNAENVNFFAMEFVAGRSLEEVVRSDGPIAPLKAIQYVTQAVRGLNAAHERGLIHRDIKPANLMLDPEDMVKVTDFGLAKSIESDGGMTKSGTILGTPHFMSPEQGLSQSLDHRTDIYSLGGTLHFLLTGRIPFEGDSAMQVIMQHIEAPVPRIERAPPSLNRLLARMMAKKPEQRHADYGALLTDLVRVERSGLLRDQPLTHSDSGRLPAQKDGRGHTTPVKSPGTARAASGTEQPQHDAEALFDAKELTPPTLDSLSPVPRTPAPPASRSSRSDTRSTRTIVLPQAGPGKKLVKILAGAAAVVLPLVLVLVLLLPGRDRKDSAATGRTDSAVAARIAALALELAAPDPALRLQAVRSLGALQGEAAARILKKAVVDRAPQVRAAAARALGQFPGVNDALFGIGLLLRDLNLDVRLAAVRSLGRAGTASDTGQLIPLLDDKDPAVRLAVFHAVTKLTGKDWGLPENPAAAQLGRAADEIRAWWASR